METPLAESQMDSYFPTKWPNGDPKQKRCNRHTHSKTIYNNNTRSKPQKGELYIYIYKTTGDVLSIGIPIYWFLRPCKELLTVLVCYTTCGRLFRPKTGRISHVWTHKRTNTAVILSWLVRTDELQNQWIDNSISAFIFKECVVVFVFCRVPFMSDSSYIGWELSTEEEMVMIKNYVNIQT